MASAKMWRRDDFFFVGEKSFLKELLIGAINFGWETMTDLEKWRPSCKTFSWSNVKVCENNCYSKIASLSIDSFPVNFAIEQ